MQSPTSAKPAYSPQHSGSHSSHDDAGDIDLVTLWLNVRPARLAAGALAGVLAGLVALVVAMAFSVGGGLEAFYPVKIPAIPLLGAEAMVLGPQLSALVTGLAVHLLLSAVLGIAYAHFTVTNTLLPLLGAGFVWGTFSWIFIFNLFIQSFTEINALQLPRGPALFVCLAFGFALSSVRWFDRGRD